MSRSVRVWLIAVPLVVLAAFGGVFGFRWYHDHPPYGPGDIHASAMIELTDGAHVRAEVTRLGAGGIQPWYGIDGDQLFVGQVRYQVPSAAKGAGRYDIVVIDKAGNQVSPLIWGSGPNPTAVKAGWQPDLASAAKRYDWLAAAAVKSSTSKPAMVFAATDTPGPITFQGAFHSDAGAITTGDLLVALVFVGQDGQIYWAQRLAG